MPDCRLTSNSARCHPQGTDSAASGSGGEAGARSVDAAPGGEASGPCIRCHRPQAPWRLAAYVCQLCWAEAFAKQAATDETARRQRQRAEQAEQAMAARRALMVCGIRRQITTSMPDWAVLGLLERVETTPVAEVAAWTRVVVEPVGWLVAAREHAERVRALRASRRSGQGRFRPGWDWADSTVSVAQAIMHHAGRIGAADGRVLAWPGMTTLVAWSGLSRRAVQYALATLCRAGFLRRVLAGTRVAGVLPGQPVALATVFELRIPLSVPELAEQADLHRALQPTRQTPESSRPHPVRHDGCTPPSSAGEFQGSAGLEYTGAARRNPAFNQNPQPRARQHWRRVAALRRIRLADAAGQLQAGVPALADLGIGYIEGCLRSWWERHHPGQVPPQTWGQNLVTLLGPWLPPWLVRNPLGLLFSKLANLDPTTEPPPAPSSSGPGSAGARSSSRARHERRRLQAEQRAFADELRQRQQAAAGVDHRAHYQQIAQAVGWSRTQPVTDPGRPACWIAGDFQAATNTRLTVDPTTRYLRERR